MATGEETSSPSQSPRRRVTGIADVPLIACQSGSSATSSLESFHLSSAVDGTTNPAYHSSDSDRSVSQDCNGETKSVPKHSTAQSSKQLQPGVYSSRITVNLSSPPAQNQVRLSNSHVESPVSTAGNDADVDSASGELVGSGKSSVDRQSSDSVIGESSVELIDSSVGQHASGPISAQLVVTSPALSQQNSVHVPAPLPHTCTSVMSETAASSYSDSELIPHRNNISHNVTEMMATEHLVTRQRPEVPRVFPVSSAEISGEQFLSLFKKPIIDEQRRENQCVIESRLHQWNLQRSRSADNSPHRHPLPNDDTRTRGSRRTKSGTRSRHLNHMSSSLSQPPVHGTADLAGVTPDSMLRRNSSSFDPSTLFSVDPVLTARRSSDNSSAGNNAAFEDFSTLTATIEVSANEVTNHEVEQVDDGVFDADFGSTEENGSAVVIGVQTVDQPGSTLAGSSSEHRVPNRAILRRGSGELCSLITH